VRRGDAFQYDFPLKLAGGGIRRARGRIEAPSEAEADRQARGIKDKLEREQSVIRRGIDRERELAYLEETGVIERREKRVDVTLGQALERYMREKREEAQAAGQEDVASVESMRSYNRRLIDHFGDKRMLSSIDANAVLTFRTYLGTLTKRVTGGTAPLSPRTKNAHMNHLRFVISRAKALWSCKVQAIKWGGDKGVLLREPKKPKQVIQTAGVDFPTLMAVMPEDLVPIFCFSLATAVRQRDAVGLRKSQVLWGLRRIRIMQKSKTPGGDPHHIPITTAVERILRQCWDQHPEFVFTYICRRSRHENEGERRDRGERYPMNKEVLRERWGEVRTKLGLADLNWHRIRASAATYYLGRGMPEAQVMAITGHKDIRSFRLYVESLGDVDRVALMMEANPILDELSRMRHSADPFQESSQLALPAPAKKASN
jgi:integrase